MKNILHTRLIRPKIKNSIRRNEKIQLKLKGISENKLTTVRGGAAVGKSTLISTFLEDKENYMWFSIDSSSDDLSCFWTYVFYGLRDNIENLDFYIDMINPLVKRQDIFDIISSLINELICDKELFIVFDDFQYIKDEFLLKTIEYLVSNASDNIHFIIISRADIPMYLSDILMKGGILDINSDDFYLSLEETSEFIKMNTKKEINEEVTKNIYSKSEGWIGAVKLLLTAVNNNKNVENVPKSSRLFIDYMNNEIISSLSKEEIDFLAVTSPLSYVNPEIYNSICGKDGQGEFLLEELLRNNMLITVIDEDKKIYRYHNILREYLLKLFDKYEKTKKDAIIIKLTDFLIKDEDYDEAMSIFMNWQMYDKALELLESNGERLLGIKVLNEFPLEFYAKSLDLTVICMFYNYLNLDYERINLIINAVNEMSVDENIRAAVELCNNIIGNVITYDIEFNYEIINGSYNVLTKMVYCILISYVFVLHGDCKKSLELIDLIDELNLKLNN